LNTGDRVQLRYCPEHRGTIGRITADGVFRVVWDTPGRKPGQERERSRFKANQEYLFVPEGTEEVRTMEDSRLDIPRELLKRYGISET
jgi:hypothetical protein